jgi:hypothetical protein
LLRKIGENGAPKKYYLKAAAPKIFWESSLFILLSKHLSQ